MPGRKTRKEKDDRLKPITSKDPVVINAAHTIDEGREIFRFDTFGDEVFWGDTLQLH